MITEEQLAKEREVIPFTSTKRLMRDDVLYVVEKDVPHPIYGYSKYHKEYSVIDLRGYRKGYEPRLDIRGIYTPNPSDTFRLQDGHLPPYQPTTTGDKLLAEMRRLGVQKAFRIGKPPPMAGGDNPAGRLEPWQMTEADWAKSPQGMQAELTPLQWRLYKDDARWIHLAHENLIHDALVEGKPVPAEVLKDYPDLTKKHSNPKAVPEVSSEVLEALTLAHTERPRAVGAQLDYDKALSEAIGKVSEKGEYARYLELLHTEEGYRLTREIPKPPVVKTEEWKLREAIADTAYGLAHGVKEEDLRKHLTRNPRAKYWFEPEDVDYILKEAKREHLKGDNPEDSERLLKVAIEREPLGVAKQLGYEVHRLSPKDIIDKDDYARGYRYRLSKADPPQPYPRIVMARNEGEVAAFLKRQIEGNPDRVRFDRADIDSAIAAAKRLESEKDLYIFATHLGYTIDRRPPPGMQSYVIVHPDGSTETIKPIVGGNPIEYWRDFTELSKSDQQRIAESMRPKPYTDWFWQTDSRGRLLLNKQGRPAISRHKYAADYQKRLLGGSNPREGLITKEEAIGLLERLSMTPGEAARSLVADEVERGKIMQTVQQRVKREQHKWAPMDPREGPPLPRIFAGLKWPWKKD